MPENLRLMIVAGENSGDAHAAQLINALRRHLPDVGFFGSTGEKMREAGVETIVKADELAIVGVLEIARALPMFLKAFRQLKKSAVERQPHAVILVDFPEFNLKLAKSLKKKGFKIIYYISPQLWAWRQYRVKTVKKYVDLMLTILPFENEWYRQNGVESVEYVGNPLAGEVKSHQTKEDFCAQHQIEAANPIIALLPGSRAKEVAHILPVLIETANLMARKNPQLQFLIAAASARRRREIESILDGQKKREADFKAPVKIIEGATREILNAADVAAVASGTATLETAIIGTPLAVVYRGTDLNYRLLRPLINVEHFGLVNLIAGERIAKEFIQHDLTKENLSAELFRLLDPAINQAMRKNLSEITHRLGDGGTADKAARAILNTLAAKKLGESGF